MASSGLALGPFFPGSTLSAPLRDFLKHRPPSPHTHVCSRQTQLPTARSSTLPRGGGWIVQAIGYLGCCAWIGGKAGIGTFRRAQGTNGMSLAPARREALLDNFRGILVTTLVHQGCLDPLVICIKIKIPRAAPMDTITAETR